MYWCQKLDRKYKNTISRQIYLTAHLVISIQCVDKEFMTVCNLYKNTLLKIHLMINTIILCGILYHYKLLLPDFPAGVVNMVFGTGPSAGEALVSHPEVPLVSFTGSTATGKHIAQVTAPMFKKLSLEVFIQDVCLSELFYVPILSNRRVFQHQNKEMTFIFHEFNNCKWILLYKCIMLECRKQYISLITKFSI